MIFWAGIIDYMLFGKKRGRLEVWWNEYGWIVHRLTATLLVGKGDW